MALILALHLLQNSLDRQRATSPRLQRFMYLPQGETLRVAALGYDQVVADLLWIEAIQAMGERKISIEAGRWIAHAIDVITTLDPHFVRVYEAGGIALATLVPMFEESNRLLEKGMKHNPQVWQLPFHLGFNYYFNFNDDPKAARYMAIASRLPGAPPYLAQLAARLYVSAKSPQLAIDFLAQMYDKTTDRNVKRVLEQRLKEVIVERDLLRLEEAIGRYRVLHKRVPDRLEDLVSSGVVRELPREPFGGRYLYDPHAGAVRSSVVKERMKLHGRRMSR
jgi:hypothetical protein